MDAVNETNTTYHFLSDELLQLQQFCLPFRECKEKFSDFESRHPSWRRQLRNIFLVILLFICYLQIRNMATTVDGYSWELPHLHHLQSLYQYEILYFYEKLVWCLISRENDVLVKCGSVAKSLISIFRLNFGKLSMEMGGHAISSNE